MSRQRFPTSENLPVLTYNQINGKLIDGIRIVIPPSSTASTADYRQHRFLVRKVRQSQIEFENQGYMNDKLNIYTSNNVVQSISPGFMPLLEYCAKSYNVVNIIRVFQKMMRYVFSIGVDYKIYTGDFSLFYVRVLSTDVILSVYDYENFHKSDERQTSNIINMIGPTRRKEVFLSCANAFDAIRKKVLDENPGVSQSEELRNALLQYFDRFGRGLSDMYRQNLENDDLYSTLHFADSFVQIVQSEFDFV